MSGVHAGMKMYIAVGHGHEDVFIVAALQVVDYRQNGRTQNPELTIKAYLMGRRSSGWMICLDILRQNDDWLTPDYS